MYEIINCRGAILAMTFALFSMLWASPAQGEYLIFSNVVLDSETGLMWIRADDGTKRTWQEALAYCENLAPPDSLAAGHDDWRMPDINELQSLIKTDASARPHIDPTAFPDCGTVASYWSSSTYAGDAANAWALSFNYGWSSYSYIKNTDELLVRCVRGGP